MTTAAVAATIVRQPDVTNKESTSTVITTAAAAATIVR
jgi:hypothetical protein